MAHQPLRESHRPQPTLTRGAPFDRARPSRMATHDRDPPGDRSRPDTFTLASSLHAFLKETIPHGVPPWATP